jgi:uroporphyrinogen-III synthase
MQPSSKPQDLQGRVVVITRPAGTAAALARRVRALGGVPVLLPGMSLRGDADAAVATALHQALRSEVLIFASPAAVRFAAALAPLRTHACVLAVGAGTARALHRHGVDAPLVPARQDSEGLLAHPALAEVRDRRVALVGAPGGRGLLRDQLAARGARLQEVHVYTRVPPRLDRRHLGHVLALSPSACVLLSSAEALQHLQQALTAPAWRQLRQASVVVSSERLAEVARVAGFRHIVRATSASAAAMLDAAIGTR